MLPFGTENRAEYIRNKLINNSLRLTQKCLLACRGVGIRPTRHLLLVSVASQKVAWLERTWIPDHPTIARRVFPKRGTYLVRKQFIISTSRFGVGQSLNSNRTPLGLHRIAARIGAGQPIGTVFESRRLVGLTWQGRPDAAIAHRILWLEGLEAGYNRGGQVDSYRRYIYIHGLGDESTVGRPASRGCIHMAAADLLPLFDRLPLGTLVWIQERPFHRGFQGSARATASALAPIR
jgi:hypothetical protein